MATDDLMTRALETLGDEGPLSVEAIHRLTDLADVPESMMIAEVADLLDLSPHTLRYYERAGLVEVARDSNGHRVYDAEAVRRLVFLTRMRLSGMPMRDLQHYVSLVDTGSTRRPSGSTGPDVQDLDPATGTDRTALPREPLRRALSAE
ncbi:MerR family transcriptional regulator [Nonomuraea sp. NPDC049152]|uniref:MerR family transcriptional regulator n=1 Tax=Nonomuraea sp. NPDC049152 TaxID=3154350 RepID=UPI0033E044A3